MLICYMIFIYLAVRTLRILFVDFFNNSYRGNEGKDIRVWMQLIRSLSCSEWIPLIITTICLLVIKFCEIRDSLCGIPAKMAYYGRKLLHFGYCLFFCCSEYRYRGKYVVEDEEYSYATMIQSHFDKKKENAEKEEKEKKLTQAVNGTDLIVNGRHTNIMKLCWESMDEMGHIIAENGDFVQKGSTNFHKDKKEWIEEYYIQNEGGKQWFEEHLSDFGTASDADYELLKNHW